MDLSRERVMNRYAAEGGGRTYYCRLIQRIPDFAGTTQNAS